MDVLKSLVETFKEGRINESGIVERIFDWITRNISYDVKAFNDRTPSLYDFDDTNDLIANVVESRKALCVGYSLLFEVMCR